MISDQREKEFYSILINDPDIFYSLVDKANLFNSLIATNSTFDDLGYEVPELVY